MKASRADLIATPQFDSGRWKLRLELVPLSADKQTTISTDLDSAAQASIDETADSTLFLLETECVADRLCEMPVFKRLRKIV
jgi:hypothetical protein